jgi:protein involved in polysaccharide export with SLBB domain
MSRVKKSAVAMIVMAATCNGMIPLPLHAQDGTPATVPAVDQAGLIRTDDLISVRIDGDAPVDATTRVGTEGYVILPMAGAVKLGGQTPDRAVATIRQAYRDRNMLPGGTIQVVRLEDAANATVRSGPIIKGDRVQVRIWDTQNKNKPTVVQLDVTDGGIELPDIGSVEVGGLTELEAANRVRDAAGDKQPMRTFVEVLRVRAAANP